MKFFSTTLALALATFAAADDLEKRQIGGGRTGSTANELSGPCQDITFIFARGSTERGNFGSSVGPPTCDGLKSAQRSVACQGVGGAYGADIGSNALPRGTTRGAITEAVGLFTQAAQRCPNTIIVAGGYSQGAAVISAAVTDLPANVKSRVAGAVLYGNTRNAQNNGKIPDYPPQNAMTYCNRGDGVCNGRLQVTAAHLQYSSTVPEAVRFLGDRIAAAGNGGGDGGAPPGRPCRFPGSRFCNN